VILTGYEPGSVSYGYLVIIQDDSFSGRGTYKTTTCRSGCFSASLSHKKKVPPRLCFSGPCKRRPSKFLRVRYEMAPYDSDSSDGEENDYTVTNVLLGYTSNEAKDDNISHLGGSPVC
jgi:hypothetical protein